MQLDTLPSFRRRASIIDINCEPSTIEEITKHLQKLKNKKESDDIDSEILEF